MASAWLAGHGGGLLVILVVGIPLSVIFAFVILFVLCSSEPFWDKFDKARDRSLLRRFVAVLVLMCTAWWAAGLLGTLTTLPPFEESIVAQEPER